MIVRCHWGACHLEFPQELSDHIFENLRNDPSFLKHCSLVCRAWLYATRTHLFRRVILTPENIDPFTLLFIDSPSTIRPHVRRLELRRIECPITRVKVSNFAPTLTHLHLRDMTFNAFIDILDIICSFPNLQSVALDRLTVETNSSGKSAHIKTKVLPSSVNSVRCRDSTFLRIFVSWLLHHQCLPKLPDFDIGPIREDSVLEIGKYLISVGPAMKHFSFSFDFSYSADACGLQRQIEDFDIQEAPLMAGHAPSLKAFPMVERFKALFGFDVCPELGALTGLKSLQVDNFIHFEDCTVEGGALVGGLKTIASIKALEIREVILGVSLRRAGELDKLNIRWEFLDEMLSSTDGVYVNLVSLKFKIAGKVNIDGIASLIRTRLPGCEKRGILEFCREK